MAAFEEAGTLEIPARVFPEAMTDDECLLAEIQENTARNELTAAERKAFAAEVGRLQDKFRKAGQAEGMDNVQDADDVHFLQKMSNSTGLTFKTLQRWWASFCEATKRDITPKKATEEDKQAFFDWLALEIRLSASTACVIRAPVTIERDTCKLDDLAISSRHHARRKRIYERLHPEVKAGTAQGEGMKKSARGHLTDNMSASYATDASQATGTAERTVRNKTRIS